MKLGNAVLQRKLLGLPGGSAALVALGFKEGDLEIHGILGSLIIFVLFHAIPLLYQK